MKCKCCKVEMAQLNYQEGCFKFYCFYCGMVAELSRGDYIWYVPKLKSINKSKEILLFLLGMLTSGILLGVYFYVRTRK